MRDCRGKEAMRHSGKQAQHITGGVTNCPSCGVPSSTERPRARNKGQQANQNTSTVQVSAFLNLPDFASAMQPSSKPSCPKELPVASATRVVTTPPPCPTCGVETVVRLEHVFVGTLATLVWRCVRCDVRWRATDIMPTRVAS